MIQITGQSIYLTRGDSATLEIDLKRQGTTTAYVIQEGDTFYFRVKRSPNAELLIEKEFEATGESTIALTLDPEDTADLLNDTDYRYEVELVTSAGWHDTFIANQLFHIGVELEGRDD